MNKEELIGKLQMVYVGDKNALNELIGYYDGLKQGIEELQQENQELKKQLKESKDNYNCLLKQKEQFEYIMSKQVDYRYQQKEFIEYLTHELNTSYTNSSRYYYFSLILSKYKEIIGELK